MKKKLMVMAAMLAMMVAMASPSFATTVAGDVDILFLDASQVQAAAALQTQQGDATAVAGDLGSAASASISQSLDISQMQFNAGL